MKTKYFTKGMLPNIFYLGVLAISLTSCGSYQNTSHDNDGIYGNGSSRRVYNEQSNTQTNPQNLQYKDYFGSLTDNQDEVEIFTDVDNYQSSNNQQNYSTGNAGWGGNSENITVNIYDNSWRYGMWNNYWYGANYGWAIQWGYSPWYGPGWGIGWNNWYNPYYGYGWNNWYGPNYGYPLYPNYYPHYNYSHNAGIRGVRNDMYGRTSARNTNTRSESIIRRPDARSTRTDNTIRTTRNGVQSGTRTYDNTNTTRSTVPSIRTSPVRTSPSTRSNNYDAAPVRSQPQAPTRTYSPAPTRSAPVMQSGGGRSSGSSGGGNMGGGSRSSSMGGRR